MQIENENKADIIAALHEAAMFTGGTIAKLAHSLGVSSQALYKGANAGGLSPVLAKRIEALTNGAVTRDRLNPSIFG